MSLLTFINTIVLALSKTTIDPGGWAGRYFTAIRQQSIEHAGVISSLAMTLACIFITFLFIKMYYDIASDEQQGGFGGIRIWDVLRPLVILLIIASFSTWVGWLDTICNTVSASLIANMNASAKAVDADVMSKLEELEDEINKSHKEQMKDARKQAESQVGKNYDQNLASIRNKIQSYDTEGKYKGSYDSFTVNDKGEVQYNTTIPGGGFTGSQTITTTLTTDQLLGSLNMDTHTKQLLEGAIKQQSELKTIENDTMLMQQEVKKWGKWLRKGGSVLGSIVTWLYNVIFVIMMAFSDIILCLLIIFGPITCALSILPPWRQNFTKWIGTYIEISMWKPIASAITWVTLQARSAIGTMGLKAVNYGVNLTSEAGKGTILGAIGVEALIMVAGIFAIFQIPGIANTLLSLGSMSPELGGAASTPAGKAMGAGKALGGKAIGTAKGLIKGTGKAAKTGANAVSSAASGASRAASTGSDFMRTMYGDIEF